jgi:hypothetical protein
MHTKLQLEYLNGRDHIGNLQADGSIILKWILKRMWTGFKWLRIGASCRLL